MGGMCDEPLQAESYDEIMKVGWEHVEKAHPEMAQNIKSMPKDHPQMVEWEKNFRETWESTPEM